MIPDVSRNAWSKLGDLSQQEAMSQYVDIVTSLSPGWDAGQDNSASSEPQQQQESRKHKSEQPMGPVFSSMAMPLEQDDHTSSNPEVGCSCANSMQQAASITNMKMRASYQH